MHNFADIKLRFLEEKGILTTTSDAFKEDLVSIFLKPDLIKKTGENAYNLVLKNRGTSNLIFNEIFE